MTSSTVSALINEMGSRAKTDSGRLHVIYRENGWAIRKEGRARAMRLFNKKGEAVRFGRAYVKNGKATELVVHNANGDVV